MIQSKVRPIKLRFCLAMVLFRLLLSKPFARRIGHGLMDCEARLMRRRLVGTSWNLHPLPVFVDMTLTGFASFYLAFSFLSTSPSACIGPLMEVM